MNESLLYEDLVLLNYTAADRADLLRKMAAVLEAKGYVKPSYADAVIERENTYPTGLNTLGVKVAMPHTAPGHVNKAAIMVAILTDPVTFGEMGKSDGSVDARLVFMLAVTDPQGHLTALGKLMAIFSDGEKLTELYAAKNERAVIDQLAKVLA